MNERAKHNLVKKVFLDPSHPAGFSSARRVWTAVKDTGITLGDVTRILETFEAHTTHRPRRKQKTRRYISSGLNDYFQIDLMVLNPTMARLNRGGFLLLCLDAFSRRLFARVLKSKRGKDVAEALHSIIKENNSIPPRNCLSDSGSEFRNSHVQDLFKRYNINHFLASGTNKSGLIERVIRTLREKIGPYMTHFNTRLFLPKLTSFVSAYNNRHHSALPKGMTPNDVTLKNELKVWKHQFANYFRRAPGYYSKPRYRVGQVVRISKLLGTFKKSSDPTFTQEKFRITHVLHTYPITYKIVDLEGEEILGALYESEIQLVR